MLTFASILQIQLKSPARQHAMAINSSGQSLPGALDAHQQILLMRLAQQLDCSCPSVSLTLELKWNDSSFTWSLRSAGLPCAQPYALLAPRCSGLQRWCHSTVSCRCQNVKWCQYKLGSVLLLKKEVLRPFPNLSNWALLLSLTTAGGILGLLGKGRKMKL